MTTLVLVMVGTVAFTAACMVIGAKLMAVGTRRLRIGIRGRLATRFTTRGGWHAGATNARRDRSLPVRAARGTALVRHATTVKASLPGPTRVVARARRDLQRDVRGAARAVTVGLQAGRHIQPLADITRRLSSSAVQLDTDLAVIAADPDAPRRRRLLAAQQDRIRELHRACEQVREGVLLATEPTVNSPLSQIVDDLNDEVIRLGLWAQAHRELRGQ